MRLKRTIILALAILFGTLVMWTFHVTCQQDVHPEHETAEEFEENMAMKLIHITSYDDRLVYWKKELKMQVKLGSFAYDKYTKLPDGKPKQTGCFWAVYCRKHDFVYFFVPCKE